MVKIKDKQHHLTIAIKENFAHGMKPKEIADLFHLSKQRENYWIHHIIKKRKRSQSNVRQTYRKASCNKKGILFKAF